MGKKQGKPIHVAPEVEKGIERLRDIAEKLPSDRPFAEDDDFLLYTPRHAFLTGLRQKGVPKRFRIMVAELVSRLDDVLESLPKQKIDFPEASGKESACIVLSDLHAGKEVRDDRGSPVFNKDICLKRLATFSSEMIYRLTRSLQPENIDEVVLLLVGDLVDGSGIYDTQYLHQDLHAVQDQVALVVGAIWDLIKRLRGRGWKVRVHGVRGNHGRQGPFAPAENNFDLLVYQMLKLMAFYEDPEGIFVEYSESAYLNVEVKGQKIHLRHIAPPQAETPAAKAKFAGWQRIHGWDILVCGHLHHPGNSSYLDSEMIMNGSIVGIDDLSEGMATFSIPSQTLFGVNKSGQTFRYVIRLDKTGFLKAA